MSVAPPCGAKPRQFGEIVAAGALGIDDGVQAKIDGRCTTLHQLTFMRARKVARSRP